MTVVVSGGSGIISYQWQISSTGTNPWANATGIGATTATYTPESAVAGTSYYRVLVNASNSDCQQAVSDTSRAIIAPDLVVTSEPTNVNECVGGADQMSVVVSGGSGIISYQWQISSTGTNPWSNATGIGATTATYTPQSAVAGTSYYRVLVNASNSDCQQAVSDTSRAIITPDLVVTSEPTNVNECIGGADQMTVVVSGGSGIISYQWQISSTGTDPWANATGTGATTSIYTPQSAVAGTSYYRVLVNASNSDCQQAVSDTSRAIITPDLVVTSEPTNVNECIGGADQMTVVVSGGSGIISYQWQISSTGTNPWANATGTGATTATYTPQSAVAGTSYYRVLVNASNSDCQQAVSDTSRAIITPDLVVTSEPTNVNECIGGADQMTVVVSGGSGIISYQWQISSTGTDPWANATGTGATTSIYTPQSAVAGTSYYRVLVNASNSDCQQAVSDTSRAIITPDLVVTSEPTNVNECIGGADQMTVVVSGGSGIISYQWQISSTGTNPWANATGTGATTATYTPQSAVAGTSYYRVLVNASNSDCQQAVSDTSRAIITPDLVVTSEPTNVNECIGGADQMTVVVSGGSGIISYQWQISSTGTDPWANATGTGATTSIYTPQSAVAGTSYYRVLVNASNSDCQQAVSDTSRAIITPDLVVTSEPTNVNECIGGADQMTVVVSGGSGIISYQWQISSTGTNPWANATGTGATTSIYTPQSAVAGTSYYRVLVNASNSDCQQAVSDTSRAIIIPDLVVTSEPTNVNECVGGADQMTVVVSGGSGIISYQWQISSTGTDPWANATGTGATTAIYTPQS